MADAFRGLTIRLGADARPLQSALSSISSSASATQKQLNMMNKALRFDGSNVSAMQARIDLMGDKAALSARAMTRVSTAIRQASSTIVEFSSRANIAGGRLDKVAANTREVHAATEKIKADYVHVDAELAHIYEAAARVKQESDGISFRKALKEVKALASEMNTSAQSAKTLRRLIQQGAMKGDSTLRADFGLGNMNNITASWKIATEVLDTLRAKHRALQGDLESVKQIDGYRAMQTQLISYEAELRQAVSETERFNFELRKMGSYGQLAKPVSAIEKMGSAVDQANAELRTMKSLYEAMPRSLDAIHSRSKAIKTAQATMEAQLKSIRVALDAVKSDPAFDKVAASSEKAYVKAVKVEHAWTNVSAKLKSAEARLEAFDAELAEVDRPGVDRTSARFKELSANVEKARSDVEKYRRQLAKLDDLHATSALIAQFKELKNAEAAAVTELGRLRAESSKLKAAMNFGAGLRELGYGLYSTLTPTIMMAGRYAIQAAADIDSAYRDMRKTVNGTEEEFEHLRDAALEFSQTHVTSADTMLEIEAMGGQLGIQARNLESFAQVISNLEIATDIGAEDMAKYVGQLSNIMSDINQQNPEEYTRNITSFSDALVRLGNNSAAQESSIMKVMMRIASLGNISGLTTPQLLAISTAVAATGQGCEAAGTAISKTFSNIEQAVGAGGDKLEAFAKVSRMSSQDFADAWNNDPITAFKAFIGGLKAIDEAGGSVDNTLTGLKITSVRQKQALEGLVNTYDVLTESLGMSQSAWDGLDYALQDGSGKVEQAGDAAREAQRKSEGFSGELEMMKNNAKVLASELADGAIPILSSLGGMFRDFASAVKGMPQAFKTTVVGAAAFLAAIGPVGVAAGTITRSVAHVIQFLGNLQVKVLAAGESLYWMAGSMTNSAGKLGAASKAVSALGKAVQFLGTTGGMLAVAGVGVAIKLIVDAVQDANEKAAAFSKATDGLVEAAERSTSVFANASRSVDTFGLKAQGSAKSIEELVEANGKLADSMNERAGAAEKEIGQLQDAQRIINRYTNKDLSDNITAQGQLKAAIELVNSECGTQYQVVDLVNGKIADEKGQLLETVDAINDYITAKKKQVEVDQLIADRADAQSVNNDNALAYAKAAENYRNTYAAYERGSASLEQLADAETKMNDALELLNSSQSTLDMIDERLGNVAASSDKATRTLENLAKSSGVLSGYFGADTTAFDAFIRDLDECGMTMEDFESIDGKTWAEILSRWNNGRGDMSKILQDLNVSVRGLAEQYNTELSGVGTSLEELAGKAGVSAGQLAEALHNAGISASDMAALGADGFDALLKAANGSIDNIAGAMDALNHFDIEPKNLTFITDDSAIDRATGRLYEFDREAKTITATPRYFRFEEDGSLAEITNEINELNGTTVDTTVNVDDESVEDAQEDWDDLSDDVEAGTEGDVNINANTEQARSKVESTYSYARQGASGTVSIYANDYVSGVIDRIKSKLTDLSWHAATVTIRQSATGNIFPNQAIRTIPRHASGGINGIVTRPMLTNIGWVGENGAEALLHMRNAGGAVVPLTNRHYVRPFARAVASEMGGGGSVDNSTTVYIDGAVINSIPEIQAATRDYLVTLSRYAEMNHG